MVQSVQIKTTIKIIGEETENYAQGYFVYDSKNPDQRQFLILDLERNLLNHPI